VDAAVFGTVSLDSLFSDCSFAPSAFSAVSVRTVWRPRQLAVSRVPSVVACQLFCFGCFPEAVCTFQPEPFVISVALQISCANSAAAHAWLVADRAVVNADTLIKNRPTAPSMWWVRLRAWSRLPSVQ
jgi:hypothetical protein